MDIFEAWGRCVDAFEPTAAVDPTKRAYLTTLDSGDMALVELRKVGDIWRRTITILDDPLAGYR